jgi:hypothetical protein
MREEGDDHRRQAREMAPLRSAKQRKDSMTASRMKVRPPAPSRANMMLIASLHVGKCFSGADALSQRHVRNVVAMRASQPIMTPQISPIHECIARMARLRARKRKWSPSAVEERWSLINAVRLLFLRRQRTNTLIMSN